MKKKVEITNLDELFKCVKFNKFYCLNELEKQVLNSSGIVNIINAPINKKKYAVFIFKYLGIGSGDHTTLFYEFNVVNKL